MGYRYLHPEEKRIELDIEYVEDPEILYKHKKIFLLCRYPINPYFKKGEKGKGVIITFNSYSSCEDKDDQIEIKEYIEYYEDKGSYIREETTHTMFFDEDGNCIFYGNGSDISVDPKNDTEGIENANKKLKEYKEVFEFIKRNVPKIDVLDKILEKI